MSARFFCILGAAALALAACGTRPGFERRASPTTNDSAGLDLNDGRSIPCDDAGKPLFDGSRVSLMTIDAIASCIGPDTLWGNSANPYGFNKNTLVLAEVYERHWNRAMDVVSRASYHDAQRVFEKTSGDVSPPVLRAWLENRTGKFKDTVGPAFQNCVPNSTVTTTESRLDDVTPGQYFLGDNAGYENLAAPVSLCVAQRLRSVAPGAAGAEGVLLSEDEQRQLLSVVRDHAQAAMLQYALLGASFTARLFGADRNLSLSEIHAAYPGSAVKPLQAWVRGGELDAEGKEQLEGIVTGMGDDFATAVQLHIAVTQELVSLFARSRSSHSPTNNSRPQVDLEAEETWGAGSWQQRLMALMYGGEPLANPLVGSFQHYAAGSFNANQQFLFTKPMDPGSFFFSSAEGNWPARTDVPFVRQAINETQVWRLIDLARKMDVLELATSGSWWEVNVNTAATSLFNSTELALQGVDCADPPCPADVDDKIERTLLWQRYRITRDHARSAALFLRDALGATAGHGGLPNPTLATYNMVGTVTRIGSAPAEGTPGEVPAGSIKFSTDANFSARSLRQLASPFTAYSAVFMPDVDQLEAGSALPAAHRLGFLSFGSSPSDSDPPTVVTRDKYDTDIGWVAEGRRRMGAISALALTRDMVFQSFRTKMNDANASPMVDAFWAQGPAIVRLIDGAIGKEGLVARTTVGFTWDESYNAIDGPWPATTDGLTKQLKDISVTEDPEDPFWADPQVPLWIVASDIREASSLAETPGTPAAPTKINGLGIADVVRTAMQDATSDQMVRREVDDLRPFWWGQLPIKFRTTSLDGPYARRTSLILIKATAQEIQGIVDDPDTWSNARFRLAAGDVKFRDSIYDVDGQQVPDPRDVRAFAYSGSLGTFVQRQITPDPNNPTKPAYDGFGLPTDWVPPTDPELLALDGQGSARYFLDLARNTSEQATAAVERAFNNLVEQTNNEVALANARDRGTLLLRQASAALCGADNLDCEVPLVRTTMREQWYPSLNQWPQLEQEDCDVALAALKDVVEDGNGNELEEAKLGLKCLVQGAIDRVLAQEVDLALPVLDELDERGSSVPTFSEFEGGQLQSALIEQYKAVKAPEERLQSLIAATDAALGRMDVAATIVSTSNNERMRECGVARLVNTLTAAAVGEGMFEGASEGASGGAIGIIGGALAGGLKAAIGSSRETLEANNRCKRAGDAVSVAKAQEFSQFLDSLAAFQSAMVGTGESLAAIARSGADIQVLKHQASMAAAQHELELDLATRSITTSFGLVREYRAYDLWRAKALLENARRYALAARRAIEGRFVVDLSDLTQAEPFVAAPSTWADEIYEYDLSLPAAVGLQTTVGISTSDGIFPNKVTDYVGNLEAFIAGYSVERPSAAGIEDIEVVTLPGLTPGEARQIQMFDSNEFLTYYAEHGSWALLCRRGNQEFWAGTSNYPDPRAACIDWEGDCAAECDENGIVGDAEDVECALANNCGGRALEARLSFALDPWGRLNGGEWEEDFQDRYNARWGRLAVNFVGTGVR